MRTDGDDKISALLGNLERAEAPEGFERRVMNRIADKGGVQYGRRPLILLALKFAVPLVLLIVIGGFLAVFNSRGPDTAAVPPVSEVASGPTASREPARPDPVSPDAANPEPSVRSVPGGNRKSNPGNSSKGPAIRSEDLAVEGPGETYTPPGIAGTKNAASPGSGGVPVQEVLGMIGAVSACGGDGCTVSSVSRGGLAERAKLAAGDRIISIDGRKVSAGTVFTGATTFKSFQVLRDGRMLNLSLSSN